MPTKYRVVLFNGKAEPQWIEEGEARPEGSCGLWPETVDTVFGGKAVTLVFVPQDDLTPQEAYLASRVTHGAVVGSEMAFLIWNDLLRHFYEMPPAPQPKPEPLPVLSEEGLAEMIRKLDQARTDMSISGIIGKVQVTREQWDALQNYVPDLVNQPVIMRQNHEWPRTPIPHENNQYNTIVAQAPDNAMKRALTSILSKIKAVQFDKERQTRYEQMREELLKAEEAELLNHIKLTRDPNDTGS